MKRIDADFQKIGANPPNPHHPRTKSDLALVSSADFGKAVFTQPNRLDELL